MNTQDRCPKHDRCRGSIRHVRMVKWVYWCIEDSRVVRRVQHVLRIDSAIERRVAVLDARDMRVETGL
jgi:hypothetical protein